EEAQHVGADPVRRVGAEARAERRLPALDGLHDADAALLEQIEDVGPRAAVLIGDRDDEAQVVDDELARRIAIAALAHGLAELALLLLGETRIAAHLGEEALDLVARRRERAAGARRLDGVGLDDVP